uniref:pectinesterase family protein n=1 Tax=Pedobacter schmidteae TaxID=2201271 RepID=UPI000EB17971|nr:pectinesterase family protein [Pedobacter schmidteae]
MAICLMMLLQFFFANAQQKYPATLKVAQDGSGDYKTIQEAVNSVRDLGKQEVKIFIKSGVYHEKLIIPSWKTNVSLIGEDAANTVITNDDYSGKHYAGGREDAFGLTKFSTYTSYTVLVQGNNFTAQQLTIQNISGKVGQAVALHIEGDKATIKDCRILGNQDTLYAAGAGSRQYYVNCYIEGTTDFIFGEATAIFQDCTVKSLSNSYITAAATTENQKFGFVFFYCKLIADKGVDRVFLGRPWRPYAKTVFIRTEMGAHIVPEGWHPWAGDAMFPDKEKTAYYAEYQSSGVGANARQRVTWSKQLSNREIKNYTIKRIFSTAAPWEPEL